LVEFIPTAIPTSKPARDSALIGAQFGTNR